MLNWVAYALVFAPMPPWGGPPLPKTLGVKWPVMKELMSTSPPSVKLRSIINKGKGVE